MMRVSSLFSVLLTTAVFSASAAYSAEEKAAAKTSTETPQFGAPVKDVGEKVDSPLLAGAPLKSDFMEGDAKAPVTLVEYASLSCSHCANFHNNVLPTLKKDYIDAGKLRYIMRPFPLNEPALKASMLIDCIGEEGGKDRYYTFARVLFDAQSKWAFDANFMTPLATFAAVGGVPKEKFDACTTDSARETKLLQWKKDATEELKVSHTPYFFINGQPYNGIHSPEAFSRAIDNALGDKGKKVDKKEVKAEEKKKEEKK